MELFYNKSAKRWPEALPLGNGRLGAMVYGDAESDIIQINEETLWNGRFDPYADNPECAEKLPEIREAIFSGDYKRGSELTYKYMVCRGAGSNFGRGLNADYGSYQTAGEVHVEFCGAENDIPADYKRTLKLNGGLATAEYTRDGLHFVNRAFTSFDKGVLVAEYKADGKFDAKITYVHEYSAAQYAEDEIILRHAFEDSIAFAVFGKILHDGTSTADESGIQINGATAVRIIVDVRTTYVKPDANGLPKPINDPEIPLAVAKKYVDAVISESFDEMYESSAKILCGLLDRAEIKLDTVDTSTEAMPTNERIKALQKGGQDNALLMEYFNFGRYLLISSSYNCVLPANLQGIWAGDYNVIWSADYHININLQMNYWLAETTGMPELTKPLIEFVRFLSEHGRSTARVQYGADGWVAHVIANPWGFTAPGERADWGSFMCGGAWCTHHITERYNFSGDINVLRENYDIFKGAAQFFLDFLVVDPVSGYLVTCPSNSPENWFLLPDGSREAICAGPTMDNQIIRDVFDTTAMAAELLGIDADFAALLREKSARLTPTRVGKLGQIMEWSEDYDEWEPGHRHLSPLYGLYPSNQINRNTPELREAARTTLHRRMEHGGGYTGWSRSLVTLNLARLGEGNECLDSLRALITNCTLPNMFDNHPAWTIKDGVTTPIPYDGETVTDATFQIDGNFGGVAAMAEMLIQSQDGFIVLLPALPEDQEWQSGSFRGLAARGGFTVDCAWKNGRVTDYTVYSDDGKTASVMVNGEMIEVASVKR
ncbi:MAG: glycoside hydrolase family 95 protein [Ruminococcaceae bacterium]|nr:glycoside hydrolase family 95 protein [Oscillospiraceae bacterium]